MNQTYMKEQKILPLLLKMSLPMVISMMVNSLYNIVDSFFVAKISENAMTALSLVFSGTESYKLGYDRICNRKLMRSYHFLWAHRTRSRQIKQPVRACS